MENDSAYSYGLFRRVWDEIPNNELTLVNLQSLVLFFQLKTSVFSRYELALKCRARFVQRFLVGRAGSQLKCICSNWSDRFDGTFSNSMKLVSNCQQFSDDHHYFNCSGKIESIKNESYMDYASHHISPEVKFVDCRYKREVLSNT